MTTIEDKATLKLTHWNDDLGYWFPFIDISRDNNDQSYLGPGHQDKESFASAVNLYIHNYNAEGTHSIEEESVVWGFAAIGTAGEIMYPVDFDHPGAFDATMIRNG